MPRSVQLHLIVFLTGAVGLCLEFACPRLLAPVYGSGHFVWSSVITITLVAFAVGYWRGGVVADSASAQRALPVALLGAGAWLILVGVLRQDILLLLVGVGLPWAPLGTAALILFVPLALLAAVYPIAVRLLSDRVDAVGRTVGRASGVSTLGSICGSLGTALFLIPNFPTGAILSGCALALAGTAVLLYARVAPRRSTALAGGVVVALGAATQSESLAADSAIYVSNSVYSGIAVHDDPRSNLRALLLDNVTHSAIDRSTYESPGQTLKALELTVYMRSIERSLVIGLGAGVLPRLLQQEYGIESHSVEIDPEVHRVAVEYFGFPADQHVAIGDGRRFLSGSVDDYGLIVLDATAGDSHPFHLFTSEAFELYRSRMTEEGILAINLTASERSVEGIRCANSILRTLEEHFAHVAILESELIRDSKSHWETYAVFASNSPLEYARDPANGREPLARYYDYVRNRPLRPRLGSTETERQGLVLTDDYSPLDHWTDVLLMADRTAQLRRTAGG